MLTQDDRPTLYAHITSSCTGRCQFCAPGVPVDRFSIEKLSSAILRRRWGRVAITGGEPTLDVELLSDALDAIAEADPGLHVGISTNGSGMLRLERPERIGSIALSRHHWDDDANRAIFGCAVPSLGDVGHLVDRLHLSLVCFKGGLATADGIERYLDEAAEHSVGRVSIGALFPQNYWCKERRVSTIDVLDGIRRAVPTERKEWRSCCECRNYLYIPPDGCIVGVYARELVGHKPRWIFDGQRLWEEPCSWRQS